MTAQAAASHPPITVRLFGPLRQTHGWGRRILPPARCGEPPTPGAIWRELRLGGDDPQTPGVGVRVAVNHHFAAPDTPLHPGDEVAFLPPISGG